jgi:hypothetical protein
MGKTWKPQEALSAFSILAIGGEKGIGISLTKERDVHSYFQAIPRENNAKFGIQYLNRATENVTGEWAENTKRYLGWMRLEIDDLKKFSAEVKPKEIITVIELFHKADWSEKVDRNGYSDAAFKHRKHAILMEELCQLDFSLAKPKFAKKEPDGRYSIPIHTQLVAKYCSDFERSVCAAKWKAKEIDIVLLDCLKGAFEDLSEGKRPFLLSAEFGSKGKAERLKRDLTIFSRGTLNPSAEEGELTFSGYDVPKIRTLFPEIKLPKLPEQPDIKLLSKFGLNLQVLREVGIKIDRHR